MKTSILVLGVLAITTQSTDVRTKQKKDETPYVINNCKEGTDISVIDPCHMCGTTTPLCYSILVEGTGIYPDSGFCQMQDPNHGSEPGVVSYTMSVDYDADDAGLGAGIYFNYQDANNFEVIYKIDFSSSVCILGYVEDGNTYNATTFPCVQYDDCEFLEYKVQVSTNQAHFTTHFYSKVVADDEYSFKPHFPVVAKAGPMGVNSFGSRYLHPLDIHMETKTCADEPDSPLCDPCVFAYNVHSVPEYPLPNYKNMLLWNARAMEMVYSACYMKVVVDVAEEQVVKVVSKVGQVSYEAQGPEEEDIKPGDLYGERNQCTENRAACVEVKYAGYVTDGSVQYMDKTLAEMRLDNSTSLTSSEVNRNLKLIYNEDLVKNTSHEFHMYIKEHVYGADFGIYCYTVQGSALTAQNYAYNMCAAGSNDPFIPPPEGGVNQNNWAVRFS